MNKIILSYHLLDIHSIILLFKILQYGIQFNHQWIWQKYCHLRRKFSTNQEYYSIMTSLIQLLLHLNLTTREF